MVNTIGTMASGKIISVPNGLVRLFLAQVKLNLQKLVDYLVKMQLIRLPYGFSRLFTAQHRQQHIGNKPKKNQQEGQRRNFRVSVNKEKRGPGQNMPKSISSNVTKKYPPQRKIPNKIPIEAPMIRSNSSLNTAMPFTFKAIMFIKTAA